MRVWMVATEMAPYSKVGGLGDVVGALPHALVELGCTVTVAVPHLPSMAGRAWGISSTGVQVEARVGGGWHRAAVRSVQAARGVQVAFIHYPPFFDRDALYGTPAGDYPDNAERFAFFAYAALEALKRLSPEPDVIHTHDWQSALVPFLLRAPEHYGADPRLSRAASVHTIHNLAYQGLFPADSLPALGISWDHFNVRELEFYGKINFLKAGLVFADALTTVSPTYAREIQGPADGWGLDGVLRERAADLHGVLNGIDTAVWDPANDPHLSVRFSSADLERRAENAKTLRADLGLAEQKMPLVGLVNRLVSQKGIDLILGLADRLEGLGLQWAILGSGEAHYEEAVRALARKYPGRVAARIGFEDALARQIYAGTDLFCMPSLFEPCGLGQMIALRYGSLPVVRQTGGLADTVRDVAEPKGVGFVFEDAAPEALARALRRGATFVADARRANPARRRAMALDFSWASSARKYLAIYQDALDRRRSRG